MKLESKSPFARQTNGQRWPVAILGATGAVGQAFIRTLKGHPWFDIAEVAASERSIGKSYKEAARWLEDELDPQVASLVVTSCDPDAVKAPVIFSALDANIATDIEAAFAKAGRIVFSNAKSYRMDADVPLVIPEVNGDHLALLAHQRTTRGWTGAIITNANCSTTVVAAALAPLHEKFGVNKLFVSTMQAVSGAGYPGVPSLDILGNVVPYIGDEEPKIERELAKMLGKLENNAIVHAPIVVTAHTNRVAVENGHTACMSIGFDRKPTVDEAITTLRDWQGFKPSLGLPTSPEHALFVHDQPDAPQPRRHVMMGRGMTTSVGRVRECNMLDIRMVAMSHNVIRGAAGGSVLNAEVLVSTGFVGETFAR
ncbi:MAG: aspartate-semialdehyde dehydrogenase [Phycisphaerae bacterium]|nr:aspartate-semialdehyde dehydrogenase [Gemmatimonadaceae bacterium]